MLVLDLRVEEEAVAELVAEVEDRAQEVDLVRAPGVGAVVAAFAEVLVENLSVAADRYAAVSGLRADIKRHLRGEPIAAREGAGLYIFGRFLRRYRWAAGAMVLLIASLAAGLAGTLWQARRAEKAA
ncbi:MAG: hypothetical protein ABI610_01835, partial [Acidobacteriota bacterium]